MTHPLNPDDLIIRQPVRKDESSDQSSPLYTLERFQELERVIRDIPLTVDPYLELAEIYRNAARWNDARKVLEKAVSRFPEDERATYLYEESQMSRSLELCSIAEAEHQAEPTSLTLEKLQRCQLEWNVLRERIFRDRLKRQPEQMDLMLPLAESLDELERRDEAIALLEQASQLPPLRATASLQLGKLLEKVGRVPEALSAYRRAALFRVPPPSLSLQVDALKRAAHLAESHHLLDSARRYLKLLVELQPNDSSIQQHLATLPSDSL